jgi:PKD repeat protein
MAWLMQRNRKRRQPAAGKVIYATLGELGDNKSPGLVDHPPINIVGGTQYESLEWESDDYSIIDFDTSEAPLRFNLKAPGKATVTITFTNADGSTFETSREYTIV